MITNIITVAIVAQVIKTSIVPHSHYRMVAERWLLESIDFYVFEQREGEWERGGACDDARGARPRDERVPGHADLPPQPWHL